MVQTAKQPLVTLVLATAALGAVACKSSADDAGKQPTPAAAPTAAPVASPAPAASPAAVPPELDARLLAVGAPAPDVSGTAHDGTAISLTQLRGKAVVVYFYPKDDTPGCTIEAQDFQGDSSEFEALGALVVGVSMDGAESHKAFADKHGLKFPLLSDVDGTIAGKFGVDTSRGVARRTTFVIGKDGKIAKVFAGVKVDGHSDEVLAAVKAAAQSGG